MNQKDIKKLEQTKADLHEQRVDEFVKNFEEHILEITRQYPEERVMPVIIEALCTTLHNMVVLLYQSESLDTFRPAVAYIANKISALVNYMIMMPGIIRIDTEKEGIKQSLENLVKENEDGENNPTDSDPSASEKGSEVEIETGAVLDDEGIGKEEKEIIGATEETPTSNPEQTRIRSGQEQKEDSGESESRGYAKLPDN